MKNKKAEVVRLHPTLDSTLSTKESEASLEKTQADLLIEDPDKDRAIALLNGETAV